MGPHFRALAILKIAVGGRHATLARFAAVAVAAGAHRAAGFAPEKTCVAEYAVEPRGLGLALYTRRTGHDHRHDACGDAPAAHHRSRALPVRQPAIGA